MTYHFAVKLGQRETLTPGESMATADFVTAYDFYGLVDGLASSPPGWLHRVKAISRTSCAIVAGGLQQRMALRDTDDEFDHLSASLNAMLDRIQALMLGLQQVSSDIARPADTVSPAPPEPGAGASPRTQCLRTAQRAGWCNPECQSNPGDVRHLVAHRAD
jgi:hypothetical protein